MNLDDWREGVAAFASLLLVAHVSYHASVRWYRRRVHALRQRVAREGELEGEKLLRRAGYTVLGRQVEREWSILVDDRPHAVRLRADLLVARRGQTYVAEVKTGSAAPRVENRSTRRQLLEYRLAFEVGGVLLVDPAAAKITSISFPWPSDANRTRGTWSLLAAALLGALIATMLHRS